MNKLQLIALAGGILCSPLANASAPDEEAADNTKELQFYVQSQIGMTYTLGESSFGSLLSPGASVNFGYVVNPLWSGRMGVSGWEAKGDAMYDYRHHSYAFNYIQLSADAVVNWSRYLWREDISRKYSGYAFLGLGLNARFHNREALEIGSEGYPFEHLWSGTKWCFAGRGGIGGLYALTDRLNINAELTITGLNDHFNSKHGKGGNIDWLFSLQIGVSYTFNWSYQPDNSFILNRKFVNL